MSYEQIAEHHFQTPEVVPLGNSHEIHVQDLSDKGQKINVLRRIHEVASNMKTGFREQGLRDAGVMRGHEAHAAHNAAIGAGAEGLNQDQIDRANALSQDHRINDYKMN